VNDYLNEYREVKGQRNRDAMDASALVVSDLAECSPEQQQAGATEGNRYLDVAASGNGVIGNICAEDFESIITDLSLNVSRLMDTFYLSGRPVMATLTVEVNGEDYPCEEGAWVYELELQDDGSEAPVVIFDRDNLPPTEAQIVIRYFEGGGDPADFCGGAE
jgi:hypothetical protein